MRFSEKQAIFAVMLTLKIIGIAPYSFGESEEDCKLSIILVVYNILLAAFIIVNTYLAEEDPLNNESYANKTVVVDTAFTVVDWLGISFVTFAMLSSILRRKLSCGLLYQTEKLDQRFKIIGIFFSKRGQFWAICLRFLVCATWPLGCICWVLYLEITVENIYTVQYWAIVFYPVVVASILTALFTAYTSGLYRKLWVVNNIIKSLANAHCRREKSAGMISTNFSYEKNLEEMIFARILSAEPGKNKWAQNLTRTSPAPSKPFWIFLENFPACFEQHGKDTLVQLRALRAIHHQIIEVQAMVADLFGPHLMILYTWYFFGILINVYASVTFQISGDTDQEYAASITWTIIWSMMAITPVVFCNSVTSEARETLVSVHKFWSEIDEDSKVKSELQAFALQIAHNPVSFTAAGVFYIGPALLFSFVVGVASNVIFLIQFDKLNLNTGAKEVLDPTALNH